MLDQAKNTDLFCDYYSQWVSVYKEGAIRKVTLDKYLMTQSWLKKLIPEVKLHYTFTLMKGDKVVEIIEKDSYFRD